MAAVSFAVGLSDYLITERKPTLLMRRLQKIIDAPDSARKRAILGALETRARDRLKLGDKVGIDWSQIDWSKVLDFLLKLFAILAPLILAGTPNAKASKAKLGRTRTTKRL